MPYFDGMVREILEEKDTLTLVARKNKELMGLIIISSKTV